MCLITMKFDTIENACTSTQNRNSGWDPDLIFLALTN